MNYKPLLLVGVLATIGIGGRLMPHMPNVAPIAALGIVVSAYFGFRYSTAVIMLSMMVSDVFIGFYTLPIMVSVYGSFIAAGFIGSFLQNSKKTGFGVVYASLVSSFLFYVVTNFAVWNFGTMYTHTSSGLVQAYAMALPFFKNTLFGDLAYTGLFFGCAYMVSMVAKARHKAAYA